MLDKYVPHTFCSVHVHVIFGTKKRVRLLTSPARERIWAFMGGIAKQNGVKPIRIGGGADHVHLLLKLPTTISIAKAVQSIKGASSLWINETFADLYRFGWQEGFAVYAVSVSQLNTTIEYIEKQDEHHRKRSFAEEYLMFLHRNGFDAKTLTNNNGDV